MRKCMTIARALKEKKRIIEKIVDLRDLVARYNAVDSGTRRPVSVMDSLARIEVLEENLLRVMAALHKADLGIARQISELMLIVFQADFYSRLDTSEFRVVVDRDNKETKVERDVMIREDDVLAKDEELNEKCDSLHDEIDGYIATHKIEVNLL